MIVSVKFYCFHWFSSSYMTATTRLSVPVYCSYTQRYQTEMTLSRGQHRIQQRDTEFTIFERPLMQHPAQEYAILVKTFSNSIQFLRKHKHIAPRTSQIVPPTSFLPLIVNFRHNSFRKCRNTPTNEVH
jgi:hypothetical protein